MVKSLVGKYKDIVGECTFGCWYEYARGTHKLAYDTFQYVSVEVLK